MRVRSGGDRGDDRPCASLIPIILRVLPPLARDANTNERDPNFAVTVAGLLVYTGIVAGILVVLDVE